MSYNPTYRKAYIDIRRDALQGLDGNEVQDLHSLLLKCCPQIEEENAKDMSDAEVTSFQTKKAVSMLKELDEAMDLDGFEETYHQNILNGCLNKNPRCYVKIMAYVLKMKFEAYLLHNVDTTTLKSKYFILLFLVRTVQQYSKNFSHCDFNDITTLFLKYNPML